MTGRHTLTRAALRARRGTGERRRAALLRGEEVARRCKLLAKMIDHAQKRRKNAINKDIKELEFELQEIKKHTSDLGSKSGAALGHNPLKQRINDGGLA